MKSTSFIKLVDFWRRSGDLNPGASGYRPNGLANRPLRPAWVLLQIVFGFFVNIKKKTTEVVFFFWRRERDSNPCGISPKRFSRPPRYDHFDIPPKQGLLDYRLFFRFCQEKKGFLQKIFSPSLHQNGFDKNTIEWKAKRKRKSDRMKEKCPLGHPLRGHFFH